MERVKQFTGGRPLPAYLLIGVRSKQDTSNVFDDKFYLFVNGVFRVATTGTTNPGGPILTGGWKKYNKKGAAVLKSDEVYWDVYRYTDGKKVPLHNGKMIALRQVGNMKYFRDGDNDKLSEETGAVEIANNSTNFHFNNYDIFSKIVSTFIGNWSAGCQVCNVSADYNEILRICKDAPAVTYALLKEF